MPSFVYQVKDASGGSSTGLLQAPSIDDASRMLRGDGKIVVDLHEQSRMASAPSARLRRVRPDDILYVTNQITVMVETGVPLTEALDGIVEQTTHTGVKAVIGDIAEQVKSGVEFSTALARHPKHFGDLYVNLVRASEVSGTMGTMLERLCQYQRAQRETRKQIRGAMLYPAVLLSFSVLVLVAMMTFVLPRFESIYGGKSAVLPLPTRLLLGTSRFMIQNGVLLAILTAGTIMGLAWYLRSPPGKAMMDKIRLRLPVLGPLYEQIYISRSMRTLATMLASGVSVLDGIHITAAVVGHIQFRDMWLAVGERLKEGRTLTEQMMASPLIPRNVAQMVASGEKTGKLPSVMNRIADFCDSDLKIGIKSMTALIEPVMIMIMGAIVGGIAISLLLPIFSISKVVAH